MKASEVGSVRCSGQQGPSLQVTLAAESGKDECTIEPGSVSLPGNSSCGALRSVQAAAASNPLRSLDGVAFRKSGPMIPCSGVFRLELLCPCAS